MPTYSFDIQGGDESDGFHGTVSQVAKTCEDAHSLVFYKALRMVGILARRKAAVKARFRVVE